MEGFTYGKTQSNDGRRKRRKELIKELLKTTPLRDSQDLNDIMKEFIAEMVNGSLQGELDDELGYDKYDTQNDEVERKIISMYAKA